MMRIYSVRWLSPNCTTIGSASISANSDRQAKRMAQATGRQIGLPNSRRMIYEGTRLVEDGYGLCECGSPDCPSENKNACDLYAKC